MTAEVDRLVADHMGLAISIAYVRTRKMQAPQWREDVRSAAIEGLWKAAKSYEPDNPQGASFPTYARWRINGAIADEMRNLITGRRKPDGTYPKDRRGEVSADEPDDQYPQLPKYRRAFTDAASDPATIVLADAEGDLLAGLIERLPEKDRDIARWYFVDGLSLTAIGRRIGRTESRICQRMGPIKKRLRSLAIANDLVEAA